MSWSVSYININLSRLTALAAVSVCYLQNLALNDLGYAEFSRDFRWRTVSLVNDNPTVTRLGSCKGICVVLFYFFPFCLLHTQYKLELINWMSISVTVNIDTWSLEVGLYSCSRPNIMISKLYVNVTMVSIIEWLSVVTRLRHDRSNLQLWLSTMIKQFQIVLF